ncbi:hypothetical protein [Desulfosporosinus sp. BICA1-9]|nr:hypothetical protein [Desulfosporosinus sp. BICA1-9]
MTDWGLAVKVFVSGVSIVMLIMFLLQLSVSASSFVVRSFEKRLAKAKE